MEVPQPEIDELLRKAIREKRLIRFVYEHKPRIVEPHDYGVHNGVVKLFGFQVAGLSSEPLPNWRWAVVNGISDLELLRDTFPEEETAHPADIIDGIRSGLGWNRPKQKLRP